ncbi:UNKNOWN [Stylonychia lemnae]|uniref:Uncharacterized protein n=1 Tax=Stylonychia lemnae TaxID=5949 RepID=A0A077ZXU5_STYLE|nr:UNKNOWN [Stylonychia lemnae]|eukprot:CDW74731.1 UNKNOWN [Stylonychia lemnae]
MNASNISVQSQVSESTGTDDSINESPWKSQVDQIIEHCVTEQFDLAIKVIGKCEPPFMPLTFSMWRKHSLNKLRTYLADVTDANGNSLLQVDVIMGYMSNKIDNEYLDQKYLPLLVEQYLFKLRQNEKYMTQPQLNDLSNYMDTLKTQPAYEKFLRVLAEWFALMELCDDLMERIEEYGIAHYVDMQQVEQKIRNNWGVHQLKDQENMLFKTFEGAKGLFCQSIVKVGRTLSSYLSWFGLIGMVQSQIVKMVIGMYFTHPTVFVGSIVSALVMKAGSDKLEETYIISELEKITDYFAIITSNLRAQYLHTSKLVTQSFTKSHEKLIQNTTQELLKAVNDLIKGEGKDNKGSLLRYFDERDMDYDKLSQQDVAGLQDWVNIVIKKDQK